MSPCIEGRVSSVMVLLFSSRTSLPRVKSTIAVLVAASGAPLRAMVTLEVSNVTRELQGALEHVYMLRFTAVEVEFAAPLLPLRSTSEAPPFSTMLPSGESLKVLVAMEVQVPALCGENSQ